jgi:hypothetical protein
VIPAPFRTLLPALALAISALPAPAWSAATTADPAPAASAAAIPAARPADVASMEAIMHAVYDVISGPAGQPRDWDRLRSLFVPGARLIPARTGKDGLTATRVLGVEDYIRLGEAVFRKEGFFEREVHRTVERFGNIAQVFDTYESRHAPSDARPFQRGINSVQLLFDGQRWWIVTIYWQAERPDLPIPRQYGG